MIEEIENTFIESFNIAKEYIDKSIANISVTNDTDAYLENYTNTSPKLLENLSYEEILNDLVQSYKMALLAKDIIWQPIESDERLMLLEAFAYRELYIRTKFNNLAKGFFLATATDTDLDNIGMFYGVTRLDGARPYALFNFKLSEPTKIILRIYDISITDEDGENESMLIEEFFFNVGEESKDIKMELDEYIDYSDVVTEIITTPLPFLIEVTQLSPFANGKNIEDDESYRKRILLAIDDKSTTGAIGTYKSFAFGADARIEDVFIDSVVGGVVDVYFYSKNADDVMKTRIEEALNADDVRPLTDKVIVQEVIKKEFMINAVLNIQKSNKDDVTWILTKATDNLMVGLDSLKKIGTSITLSEINDFLKVSGVKEVVIQNPTSNILIAKNEIGVCIEQNITFTYI